MVWRASQSSTTKRCVPADPALRSPALALPLCPLLTALPVVASRLQPDSEQQQVIREIYQHVSKRADNVCNFLEGTITYWGEDVKLVYRHYATLYFVFAVDKQESDLGILDLIQGEFLSLAVLGTSPEPALLSPSVCGDH